MKQLITLFGIALCLFGTARAQTLLNQATVANLATVAPPFNYTFTATTAQALTLTLTDFKTPAAFGALQVAVTSGNSLIGAASVASGTSAATLAFSASQGTTYQVSVVGTPDTTQGLGSFGVCVAPATSPASCIAGYSNSANIQNPSTTSASGSSQLTTNFTASSTGGTYSVTVTDDAFPAALANIGGVITQGVNSVGTITGVGSTPVTLTAGTTYQLILGAVASGPALAGLYGVRITDPNGVAVFDRTVPVGTLASALSVENKAAQGLDLTLTDLNYPAALATAAVAVTQGSKALATLLSPGAVSDFLAPAGNLQIWQYAAAGAMSGVYDLNLAAHAASGSGTSLYSTTQVVNPTGASTTGYAFVATLPSAGTYKLAVNDFQFPTKLGSGPTATVAQGGTVLTQDANGNFAAQAGEVVVFVAATAPASGEGIFGVTLSTTGASPKILLDQTQALGGEFTQQTISVGAAGQYQVTLSDLGTTASADASLLAPFPFQQLAVAVSLGSQVAGKIYTSGSFAFTAPGNYVVTVLATPGTGGYGLYGLNIAAVPPTLTFSASAASVTVGSTVQLTWSSQNASSCTAGGSAGWTGPQALSGNTAVALSADATLTLTCAGAGGSVEKSVSVTTTPVASSGGSGGGGSVDPSLLLMLTGILAATASRARNFRLSWRHEVGLSRRLRRASAGRPSVPAQQIPAAEGPAAR